MLWRLIRSGLAPHRRALSVIVVLQLVSTIASLYLPNLNADIIDYGTLKTGANRAGSYFAVVLLIVKGTAAIGGGLAAVSFALGVAALLSRQEGSWHPDGHRVKCGPPA